jgi:beta-N-acetylhexosaminidase
MRRPLAVVLAAVFVVGCTAVPPTAVPTAQRPPTGGAAAPSQPPTNAGSATTLTGRPTLAQLIGQKLVVRMEGRTPSADLLGRIRRGEVGGVILFGANITTKAALITLTHTLRAAARAGGQPPLLIAVDQEGGTIKRIPWAPPTLSPPQMGSIGKTSVARAQGSNTGTALLGLGIDVDFAPVADVPSSTSSFMYKQGRTFSFNSTTTAALSDAFARGLASAGVLPSMKHFPGLGRATANTDAHVVTIKASAATLAPGLRPYRTAIGHDIPMIMLSNATYTAYDSHNAAGWSHAISVDLLRGDLAFSGVTITDSLDGTAAARGLPTWQLAVRAAKAGTDMILVTGSEATTKTDYDKLLSLAKGGFIARSTLLDSYDRILALKAGL